MGGGIVSLDVARITNPSRKHPERSGQQLAAQSKDAAMR
jgi:hypothetical protein